MSYQWDPAKAAANRTKHGIAFADVVAVFEDEMALTRLDESAEEERFVTLGIDALGRLVVVVYTWRENEIRIISAREATRAEREAYEG